MSGVVPGLVERGAVPLIVPDWPAPRSVQAVVTTRLGGVSTGPYASFNLGDDVGDDPAAVIANPARSQNRTGRQSAVPTVHTTPISSVQVS